MDVNITTWNLNGLRQLRSKYQTLKSVMEKLNSPDILCVQEVKMNTRSLRKEAIEIPEGYESYFALYDKENDKNSEMGYSGVATFVKTSKLKTFAAVDGLTDNLNSGGGSDLSCDDDFVNMMVEQNGMVLKRMKELDGEGRVCMTDHGAFILINVYVPFVNREQGREESEEDWKARVEARSAFKRDFLTLLRARIDHLRTKKKRKIVMVGDMNVHAQPIDVGVFDPREKEEVATEFWSCQDNPVKAFSRSWFAKMLEKGDGGLIDSFRVMHPNRERAYTCWMTLTSARETNFGTRIDYILIDQLLFGQTSSVILQADILPQVDGSDHCPVTTTISIPIMENGDPLPLPPSPMLFKSNQTRLNTYFTSGAVKTITASTTTTNNNNNNNINNNVIINNNNCIDNSTGKNNTTATKSGKSGNTSILSFLGKRKESETSSKSQQQQLHIPPPLPLSVSSSSSPSSVSMEAPATAAPATATAAAAATAATTNKFMSNFSGVPKCNGHNLPCVVRKVKDPKKQNFGKTFYCCCKPEGEKTNKEARCDFFMWESEWKEIKREKDK